MMMLVAADVAAEFYRVNSGRKFGSARELVDAIDKYMTKRGLAKSTIDRLDVAEHVLDLLAETRQPMATPEQVAWEQNLAQGISNPADDAAMRYMDELALAGQVAKMSDAEYASNRQRLGMTQDLVSFLGGWE
jgi:hypothetical protein